MPGLAAISPWGWTGVDLFFVLSGYLIASQLLKPLRSGVAPSLREFYLKRSFRILPAYLTVVGLYFFVPAWNEAQGISPLWKFLTFTQNFGLDRLRAGGFSHAWSLCVEEHFYLLLPVAVLLGFRLRGTRISRAYPVLLPALVLVLGAALRAALWMREISPARGDLSRRMLGNLYDQVIYYPSTNRLDGCVVGVLIALGLVFKPDWKARLERHPDWPAAVGLVLLALGAWLTSDRVSFAAAVFGFPVLSLGYGGLVLSAAIPQSVLNRARVPGAATMATLSYSFYLTHKALMGLSFPALKASGWAQGPGVRVAGVFCVCLLGAWVLWFGVERPFLGLRERFLKRRP